MGKPGVLWSMGSQRVKLDRVNNGNQACEQRGNLLMACST